MSTTNRSVTPCNGQSAFARGPAFQAREIEEPADIYFFRPLGFILARSADTLGVTPSQLTILGMLVGVIGGALLYGEHSGLIGFVLLIIHNIFDSADGQLARLTARVTELGRVLDGVGDYVTHAAIYIAIPAGLLQRGESNVIIVWAVLSAIANMIQAQMYEYHRHHYATIVTKMIVPHDDPARITSSSIRGLYRLYLTLQQMLNGLHPEVISAIAKRSTAGVVRQDDRTRYRECFCRPMRGWNLLGPITRFCAIGVLVCLHRIDLFFAFILVPMNLALITLWLWQRSADRKFLARL